MYVVITKKYFLIPLVLFVLFSDSCRPLLVRQMINPSQTGEMQNLPEGVKVHMKDGSLYVLDSLITYDSKDTIEGWGTSYNKYRDILSYNPSPSKGTYHPAYHIPLSGVALLELNKMKGLKGRTLAMALVGVPTVLLTGICLTNPKACFGSCPTFYSWDGRDTALMAEGFSSSILKVYEKEDIDMLYWAQPEQPNFHLIVKNEALETHIIREADILAIPRSSAERVFASGDAEFYKISMLRAPELCVSSEGDCREAILEMDQKERFNLSDPDNLAEREYIEMSFSDIPRGELGLLLSCRQTLMTTYLFYQGLAYLGNSAGYFEARIESGDKFLKRKVDKVWDILGGIEVFIKYPGQKWKKVEEIREMGPIASDIHLIKLPASNSDKADIKLRLTKGLWRIDYIALGKIDEKVDPITIKPSLVTSISNSNSEPIRVPQLIDPDDPLITLPGDIYDICYNLPDYSGQFEIFLKSRGYYIEWMRETWIKEENLKKAALLFGYPRLFMKMAADDFKLNESSMEESFWNSKYVKKE